MYHVPCQFAERRTDPLSGTSLMNIEGFLRLDTFTRNNKELMKLQLQETTEGPKKKVIKNFGFLTDVFFDLQPLSRADFFRFDPSLRLGGWTGVSLVGCQCRMIDSLLAPRFLFWY